MKQFVSLSWWVPGVSAGLLIIGFFAPAFAATTGPVVESVFPRNVSANFANALIITGSHFSPGTTVLLKDTQVILSASSVEINDDHTLTATVAVPNNARGP